MQAALFDQSGEPGDVLRAAEVPQPVPQRGEVLVRMQRAPINPSDLLFVRGQYTFEAEMPAQAGFEGTGVVQASGGGLLAGILKGRRVTVVSRRGATWAEYAVIPAKQAIPISSRLSLDQAATFFINPATAYILARRLSGLRRGDWLLQTAAGSAVGRMVIRLASQAGIKTVNVVRRDEQVDDLQRLGADIVLVSPDDLPSAVQSATQKAPIRYALDPVGGPLGAQVLQCLAPGGRLICYGTLDGRPVPLMPRDLIAADRSLHGFWLGHYLDRLPLLRKLGLIRTLTKLVLDGTLTSQVAQVFPLANIQEAVRAAEIPGRDGKILLSIGS